MLKLNQKGFAAIVPLLVVAGIFILAFSFKNFRNGNGTAEKSSVLSESVSGGDGQGNPAVSLTPLGGSSLETLFSTTTRTNSILETPEPSEKPETVETPEPKETPEAEIENEVETDVEEGTLSAKIKIQKGSDALQFEQDKSSVQVQGNFPLSVNSATKQLTISTPGGQQVVAVLPDSAVQNILNTNVLSQVAANSQNGKNDVKITIDSNGNAVYEINGVKFEKLFGLFSISLDKSAQVSVQSGQLLGLTEAPLTRLLDILSF